MKFARLLALSLIALTPLTACGSAPQARPYDDVLANRDRTVDIEIRGDVVHACGLDTSRTYFAYSSADLTDDDKLLLGDVARCLIDGKLKGRSILVSGYTDKTGPTAENKDLGMSRSEIVAQELNTRGVPTGRIFLRSTGERLATGDTASERALDRKVELRIVEREF